MRAVCLGLACAFLLLPSKAFGAGLAASDNFVVLAPDQPLADEILDAAEGLRKQIALDWLGAELPARRGRTAISIRISDTENRGFTWLIDDPRRKMHSMWLATSRENATGNVLAHEMTHVVLATQFQGHLPAWADEGVASLRDNPRRIAIRQEILGDSVRSGHWTNLAGLLRAESIPSRDQAAYAAAVGLTRYLLTRGSKTELLRFAVDGRQDGWDQALQKHYGIQGVAELQKAWQSWVANRAGRNDAPLAVTP